MSISKSWFIETHSALGGKWNVSYLQSGEKAARKRAEEYKAKGIPVRIVFGMSTYQRGVVFEYRGEDTTP